MQIDDYNAIKTYMAKTVAKNPKALTKQVEFKLWADTTTWYDQNANPATLLRAKEIRNQFNVANGTVTPSAPVPPNRDATPATSKERLTIKLGSTGENVKEWQRIMKMKVVDGRFSPDVRLATITWQKNNGLFADGVVGPISWKKALGLGNPLVAVANAVQSAAGAVANTVASAFISAPTASAPLADPPASRVASRSAITTILRQGSKGQDVKNWQAVIGLAPSATGSGVFDAATTSATKSWQKSHGLTPDGIVGPQSWAAAIVLENQTPIASTGKAAVKEAAKAVAAKIPGKKTATAAAPTSGALVKLSALGASGKATIQALPLWQKIVGGTLTAAVGFLTFKSFRAPRF